MANHNFGGNIRTLHPNVVRLYSQVVATGADHPNWMDDTAACDEERPPSSDNGRNLGIYGWSRQGTGIHKIVFMQSYAYLLGCGVVSDDTGADDEICAMTILDEDVAAEESPSIVTTTAVGPLVHVTFYDADGNASELADGNIVRVWFDLAATKLG